MSTLCYVCRIPCLFVLHTHPSSPSSSSPALPSPPHSSLLFPSPLPSPAAQSVTHSKLPEPYKTILKDKKHLVIQHNKISLDKMISKGGLISIATDLSLYGVRE